MLNRQLWQACLQDVHTQGVTEEIRMAAAVCLAIDSGVLVEVLMTLLQEEGSQASKVHFGQLASVVMVGHALGGMP